MIQILKVVVGSQAHGLANENSDYDYRGVFVVPTPRLLIEEFLPTSERIKHTSWIEGKEYDISWEIGKFLLMATKCNPTVLETFLAPRAVSTETTIDEFGNGIDWGLEIQSLFPHVWNSTDVKNAFSATA